MNYCARQSSKRVRERKQVVFGTLCHCCSRYYPYLLAKNKSVPKRVGRGEEGDRMLARCWRDGSKRCDEDVELAIVGIGRELHPDLEIGGGLGGQQTEVFLQLGLVVRGRRMTCADGPASAHLGV